MRIPDIIYRIFIVSLWQLSDLFDNLGSTLMAILISWGLKMIPIDDPK